MLLLLLHNNKLIHKLFEIPNLPIIMIHLDDHSILMLKYIFIILSNFGLYFLYSYIQKTETHPFSRCGFSGRVEIVCCPNKYVQPPKPNTGTIGQDKFGRYHVKCFRDGQAA